MVQQDGVFPQPRVYVASSWRNQYQPKVVQALRAAGYYVYDFKNPVESNGDVSSGFSFPKLSREMESEGYLDGWNHEASQPTDFMRALKHPTAVAGYQRDMNQLFNADIVVMVLPCERDAHTELGWAVGAGKQTHILLDSPCKASLMYQMADFIHPDLDDLLLTLGDADQ